MNVLEFGRLMRRDNAEVVLCQDVMVKAGEHGRYFYAFCRYDGELFSVNSHFRPTHPYPTEARRKMDVEDKYKPISLNLHGGEGKGFEFAAQSNLVPGLDPRVVSDGNNAYAVFGADDPNDRAFVYNFSTGKCCPIRISDFNLAYGKNWQPFLVEDELFVVHELNPFRILKIDPCSGRAKMVREVDVSFNMPAFYEPYTIFRGGGNAIYHGGTLLGLGHATSHFYRHHPFLWGFSDDGRVDILFTDTFSALCARGYNIIDPTSVFFDGEDLMVGLCCSERDWKQTQLFSHFLIRFRSSATAAKYEPLDDFLRRQPLSQERGAPNLDRHMFFCTEMPSAILGGHQYGGRLSNGVPGHLVHGPYLKIEKEGRYCAELTYLTKTSSPPTAGVFDITVSWSDGRSNQPEFKALGAINLAATNGELQETRIEFDTTGLRGALLEMRVYVHEKVEMNAFHIRTWRTDQQSSAVRSFP